MRTCSFTLTNNNNGPCVNRWSLGMIARRSPGSSLPVLWARSHFPPNSVAELPVQWQCVLCQETMGRQSASPHETQCSSGLARVYSRRPGAGASFYNSCLVSSLLPPPPPPAAGVGQRKLEIPGEGNTDTAARLGPGVRPLEVTTDLRIDFTIKTKALTSIA